MTEGSQVGRWRGITLTNGETLYRGEVPFFTMSVLRSIESKLESLFEGVFGRAFRTNVQPVELARKLVKEMDEHRNVSVSRVYVPNEYTIFLSTADHAQFASYEEGLRDELQDYLAEHARRERYVLLTAPRVRFETDADLDLGVFGIATRLVRGAKAPAEAPATEPASGSTMIYRPETPLEAPPAPAPVATSDPSTEDSRDAEEIVELREVASVTFGGRTHQLTKPATVLGRSRECDLPVSDPNVSRRHAEIREEKGSYIAVDLGSTNGIEVEGRRVKRLELVDGTRFTIGSTEVAFSQGLA